MIDLFGNSGETHASQGQFERDPLTGALVPTVVEQSSRGERAFGFAFRRPDADRAVVGVVVVAGVVRSSPSV